MADSDVPVSREMRRRIAVWVDEGRDDAYIRGQLVAAYGDGIDYNPSASGVTSLVWVLPVLAGGGILIVLAVMLTGTRSEPGGRSPTGQDIRPEREAGRADGSGEPPDAPAARRPRQRGPITAWAVLVVAVSATAGVSVARIAGSRDADSSITGSIRSTSRELIFQAQRLLQDGDTEGAIGAYDEALELQPSNPEALTYRGWLTSRSGDSAAAVDYLDDAIGRGPGVSRRQAVPSYRGLGAGRWRPGRRRTGGVRPPRPTPLRRGTARPGQRARPRGRSPQRRCRRSHGERTRCPEQRRPRRCRENGRPRRCRGRGSGRRFPARSIQRRESRRRRFPVRRIGFHPRRSDCGVRGPWRRRGGCWTQ